jgi:hypothetical protein
VVGRGGWRGKGAEGEEGSGGKERRLEKKCR